MEEQAWWLAQQVEHGRRLPPPADKEEPGVVEETDGVEAEDEVVEVQEGAGGGGEGAGTQGGRVGAVSELRWKMYKGMGVKWEEPVPDHKVLILNNEKMIYNW